MSKIKYPQGVNQENLVAKLKSARREGDAFYCWDLCVAAAARIDQLEKDPVSKLTKLSALPKRVSFRVESGIYKKLSHAEAANYRDRIKYCLEDRGVPEVWASIFAQSTTNYVELPTETGSDTPDSFDTSGLLRHLFFWSRTPEGAQFWQSAVEVIEDELYDEDVGFDYMWD